MRRILVTAVSGDIGNGILKILQETEDEIYGCDINEYAAGMDKVKKFFVVPSAIEKNYVSTILNLCTQNQIQYLIPVNEREIEVISGWRNKFEEQGIILIIQSNETLDNCLDKYRCMKYLRLHSIQVPDTWLASDKKDIQGRYILKPRKSSGSKNIKVIEGSNDIGAEERTEGNLIQEYIPGDREYTIGIFSDGHITNVICFRRKLKNGYSDFVELFRNKEIETVAKKIADLFRLRGYINVQMKMWQEKYYIFEINPRISGTVYFRHMLGFCDVLWWLDMADGKVVPYYQCPYESAVGLRELKEKLVELRRM